MTSVRSSARAPVRPAAVADGRRAAVRGWPQSHERMVQRGYRMAAGGQCLSSHSGERTGRVFVPCETVPPMTDVLYPVALAGGELVWATDLARCCRSLKFPRVARSS